MIPCERWRDPSADASLARQHSQGKCQHAGHDGIVHVGSSAIASRNLARLLNAMMVTATQAPRLRAGVSCCAQLHLLFGGGIFEFRRSETAPNMLKFRPEMRCRGISAVLLGV